MRLNNTVYSTHNDGRVTFRWLWTQVRKIAAAGESWFVVSLVGTFMVLQLYALEVDKIMDRG